MNADGRPGVNVDVQLGARVGWVLPLGLALLLAALVAGGGAVGLIAYGVGREADPALGPDETQSEPTAGSMHDEHPPFPLDR